MKEKWKDINGFEGLYQISNTGKIKSFRRSSKFGSPEELILKPSIINSGYHVVTLYHENSKKRKYQVHRLVAEAFLPNPQNLPCVNHKDENKTNNNVDNLEWCTYQYNNNYGTAREKSVNSTYTPVVQKSLDGVELAKYRSPAVAGRLLGIDSDKIRRWCKSGTGGGYLWELID